MGHHVKVGAFRLREHSELLGCDRRYGVGFIARCDCGEKSRVVGSHAAARAWAADHMKMRPHA